MGEQVGELYADLHRQHGVDLRFNTGVEGFEGDDKLTGVRVSGGEVLPADLVVVGVGVQPNIELAEAAGIEVASREDGSGIRTGADLQTSVPGVYAAGDVVRWDHPLLGHSIRVEHWQNAKDSGEAAAKAMLGAGRVAGCAPVLLHRPVRPRHGVRRRRAARRFVPGRPARRPGLGRLPGVLAGRRQPRARGHARQHVGCDRRDQGPDPGRTSRSTRTASRTPQWSCRTSSSRPLYCGCVLDRRLTAWLAGSRKRTSRWCASVLGSTKWSART